MPSPLQYFIYIFFLTLAPTVVPSWAMQPPAHPHNPSDTSSAKDQKRKISQINKTETSDEDDNNPQEEDEESKKGSSGEGSPDSKKSKIGSDSGFEDLPSSESKITIHVFAVGAGNCILAHKNTEAVLVDCGTTGSEDHPQKKEIIEEIQNIIANKQVQVILTHNHKDHYSWIPNIFTSTTSLPQTLIMANSLNEKTPQVLHSLINKMQQQNKEQVIILQNPAKIESINEKIFDWIKAITGAAAHSQSSKNPNADSIILKVKDKGSQCSVLLPGDATKETFNSLESEEALDTTILVAPHHGSATEGSNTLPWIKATDPHTLIISAGKKYGHPVFKIIKNYIQNSSLTTTTQTSDVPATAVNQGEKVEITSDTIQPAEEDTANWQIYNTHNHGNIDIELATNTYSITSTNGLNVMNQPCAPFSTEEAREEKNEE
ncbi:ComEC/Rec2 family competence protein [Candidatus Odyssella acanthamoebae]|uniref:Metallo-beta-lactamase domain-containing protein n=1 Tax=Candidatus Odyssella acanthamoebae TaxID=91604 RepID=A0A077B2Q5_9PROT|nr:MBL fold metallo-hydrolase [Candidatus Paracaedibacter acanthamoebae]AIK97285.1 hypothetical protein ID47_11890 [Candidatus Paracaedibacter acanthamoebae]